ncbi:MAG: hypothetical protein IJA36_05620 [Lachnospiraceae bacterium]|nr:hypothetical protein [Lachnospiraceae bacterium]
MKKSFFIQLMQWIGALLLAMAIVSVVGFFYYRPVGWLERDKNATSAVWEPNTVVVNFLEGGGITRVDSHGYTNPWGKELDDELVLCIGASYVQSKEVMENKKYTSLLNEMLTSEDKLKVYNLSRDAYLYPEIVAGFSAAIQEFPQTKVAVIDISNTDYSLEELKKALIQREYSPEQTGDKLYAELPAIEKIKIKVKDYFPITSILKHQMSQMQGEGVDVTGATKRTQEVSEAQYGEALDATMKQMREAFSGEIIILYHPSVLLNEDGSMSLNQPKYRDVFEEMCQQNGIVFADMGDDFLQAYEERKEVPYGFQNVTIGEGHLNKYGHKMIAKRLYDLIEKE